MRRFGKWFLIGVALLCWSGIGSAATVSVNCTVVSSSTELSANMVCAQFNPNAGTLESVQITVNGGITGTITLANHASTSQTGSGAVNSQFNVGALAGVTVVNPVFTASYGTGTQTLNAGQTATFAGLSGAGSGNLGTNSSNLAPYTGDGTFSIPISTSSGATLVGGGGQFEGSGSTSAQATAVVTYTY